MIKIRDETQNFPSWVCHAASQALNASPTGRVPSKLLKFTSAAALLPNVEVKSRLQDSHQEGWL